MDNEQNVIDGATADKQEKAKRKSPREKWSGKMKAGLAVLIVGLVMMVGGVVLLLVNLLKAPMVQDAEYLTLVGEWQLEDEPTVIWDFQDIGKGSLTTNFHINDYDFIWAMEGDTLKIETEWLYTLNDDYEYKLDQEQNRLTLTSGEKVYVFVPVPYEEDEAPEEN